MENLLINDLRIFTHVFEISFQYVLKHHSIEESFSHIKSFGCGIDIDETFRKECK